MGRIKLRRSRVKNKLILFSIVIIFSIFISFLSVIHISEKVTPILLDLATMKLNKYSTTIVNKAVSQVLDDKIEIDSLFEVVKNKNDEIQMIDFDTAKVNHALNIATTVVQNNIKILESGDVPSVVDDELEHDEINSLAKGIVVEIPIGSSLGVTYLANLGPMLPIRFQYIGDVNSNIETKKECMMLSVQNVVYKHKFHLILHKVEMFYVKLVLMRKKQLKQKLNYIDI